MLAASKGDYQRVKALLKWNADTTYQGHVSRLFKNNKKPMNGNLSQVHNPYIVGMNTAKTTYIYIYIYPANNDSYKHQAHAH